MLACNRKEKGKEEEKPRKPNETQKLKRTKPRKNQKRQNHSKTKLLGCVWDLEFAAFAGVLDTIERHEARR